MPCGLWECKWVFPVLNSGNYPSSGSTRERTTPSYLLELDLMFHDAAGKQVLSNRSTWEVISRCSTEIHWCSWSHILPPPQTSSSSRTQLSALPQEHPSLLPQYTTVNFRLYVDCMHPKHVLNASSIPRVLHNTMDAAVERVTVSNSSLKLLKLAFFCCFFWEFALTTAPLT